MTKTKKEFLRLFEKQEQANLIKKLNTPLSTEQKQLRLKQWKADKRTLKKFLDVKRQNEEYAKKHPSKISFSTAA